MKRRSLFTMISTATALVATRYRGVCVNVWEDSRLGCLGAWPSRLRWRAWRRSSARTLASEQARRPFYHTAGTAMLHSSRAVQFAFPSANQQPNQYNQTHP